ncbi:hypothetical protein [Corynebacterium glucuronolyticum]|uniref:hypothetical protein n=1 Tax=Corynebacterium glucuronolyticum TaxID=39791 RepID=UPI00223C284E|nr:hypothetical protein [Corynebacterium glucuronolyticum]MCT1442668.1 hypothetical protein [Corynebacterium glucuronolyticum]
MRKFLAVATAATVAFASATPALAAEVPEAPAGFVFEQDFHPGGKDSSSTETFYYFKKTDDKDKTVDQIVLDVKGKTVCDTTTQNSDFMWEAGTSKCTYKEPIDVIKDITGYITAIAAAIGALFAIYTTAQKFVK